jgi:hypothetical protein
MGWRQLTPPPNAEWIALYGLWIQTGAIVVSAIGVIITVFWMKHLACLRATLDIVLTEQTDAGTIEKRTLFTKLRDEGHLSKWADPKNTHGTEAATLRAVLNRYELVAIGIKRGTLHEDSYRAWCRTTLVKDWTACKPLVMQLRQNDQTDTYYCEFEALAKKWATPAERKHT